MDTIKSKSQVVRFEDGRSVQVRRLRWKAARTWLRKLGAQASAMINESGLLQSKDEGIDLPMILKCASEIIEKSDDLIMELLAGSCRDMKPEMIDELDTMEASALIAAAIEVNLDDELKNCWTGVVSRLALMMTPDETQTPTTPSDPSMPVLYEQGLTPDTSTIAP